MRALRYIFGFMFLAAAILVACQHTDAAPSGGNGCTPSASLNGGADNGCAQPTPIAVFSHFPMMVAGDGTTTDDGPTPGAMPTAAAGLPQNIYVSVGTAIDTYTAAPYAASTRIWYYTFPSRVNSGQVGQNCNYWKDVTSQTNCAAPPATYDGLPYVQQYDFSSNNCTSAQRAVFYSSTGIVVDTLNPAVQRFWWKDYFPSTFPQARVNAIFGVFFDALQRYDFKLNDGTTSLPQGSTTQLCANPVGSGDYPVSAGTPNPDTYQLQHNIPFLNSFMANEIQAEATSVPAIPPNGFPIMINGLGGVQNGQDVPDDAIWLLGSSGVQYAREEDCGMKKTTSGSQPVSQPMVAASGYPSGGWLDKMDDLLMNTEIFHKIIVCQSNMVSQDPGDTTHMIDAQGGGGVEARLYSYASFLMAAQPQYDVYWTITCYNFGNTGSFSESSNCGGVSAPKNKMQTFPETGFTCYEPVYWGADNVPWRSPIPRHVWHWPTDVGDPLNNTVSATPAPGASPASSGLNVPWGYAGATSSRLYAIGYQNCFYYTYGGAAAKRVGSAMIVVNADPTTSATLPSGSQATFWMNHYTAANCPQCELLTLSGGTDATIDGGGTATLPQTTLPTTLISPRAAPTPAVNTPASAIIVDPNG